MADWICPDGNSSRAVTWCRAADRDPRTETPGHAAVTGQPGEETAEDLDGAIGVMQEMLAAGEPVPQVAAALGQALAERYSEHGDDGDRDEAITWLRRACDAPAPAGHDPDDDLQLAMLLIDRGDEHRDVADVEAGLGYAERGPGRGPPATRPVCARRGPPAAGRARPRCPPSCPSPSVTCAEAAAHLPEGSPERADVNARLGVALALWVHADAAMDGTDALDEAILLLARARDEIPPEMPTGSRCGTGLAAAWTIRFMWSAGSQSDLERALAEFEVLLSEPEHPGCDGRSLPHLQRLPPSLPGGPREHARRRSFMMNASRLGGYSRGRRRISRRTRPGPLPPTSTRCRARPPRNQVPVWCRGCVAWRPSQRRAQLCSRAGIQTLTSTRR